MRLLPALIAVLVAGTTSAPVPAAPNSIVLENQQPGTTSWQFTDYNKAQNHEIEGYASLTSVNKGSPISFMVSLSSSAQYNMDIYRMGWYPTGTNPDGTSCAPSCGGRLMQHVGPLNGVRQAACPTVTSSTDPNFGMIECNWTPSYTLTVPTAWTQGVYLVKLTRLDGTQLENDMTFVVRDNSSIAPILYSLDTNTWQAYNFWGGAGNNNLGINLYARFNDVTLNSVNGSRAYTVSFDRPYLDQGEIDGAGNFFVWDFPMVRWMESQGYDMTYDTDTDLEANPNLLGGHHVFVNTGHDEYYSDNMRSALQNGIAAGVNLALFSANNVYSRVTWGSDGSGAPLRRIHTSKGSLPDGTVEFRSLTPPQPENALLGVMQNGVATSRPFLVYDASSWIYAGTGLVNYTGNGTTGVVTSGPGQNALAGIIGYEFDERAANASSLSSFVPYEPPGIQQVGHSFVPAGDGNGVNAWSDATLYTAPSGATVFAAGTIQWSFTVDNGYNTGFCSCDHNVANSVGQAVTANVLNRFAGPPTPAPFATLSPTSLSFGSQTVGTTSPSQAVTLTNTGSAPMTISNIGFTGANSGDYAQTNTCPLSPNTLAANANCTITVSFSPTATGTRTASLAITDDAPQSPQTVALSGTGVSAAPAVSFSPTSLGFGSQQVGTTSAAQNVTLTNSGNAALTITTVAVSGTNAGDFAQTNTCPISPSTLAAGASCAISATFTPTATGSRTANISVTDDAGGSPQTVALTGTGTAPVVTLNPTSLSFGNQIVGTTSPAQTTALQNTGSAPLGISSIGLAGANPGDYTEISDCPLVPATLAPGFTCTISASFAPTATGSRPASISITDNAGGSPHSVALSGTGVAPGPAVSFSPTSLGFGSQQVGTTSAAQNVTLTNSGNAALTITTVAVSGTNAGDFAQTNTCPISPSTLAAGASCAISATFTPTATGSRTANISVTDDAGGSPHTVALTGTGSIPIAFDRDLGSKNENATSATMTLTTSVSAVTQARVFLFVNWFHTNRTLTSVSGGGLTWAVDAQTRDSSKYHGAIASADAPAGLAAGTVITATFSGSVAHGLIAAASFTGIASTNPRDGTASNTQRGVVAWTGSVTTTNANDLILGWSGIDSITTSSPTAPNIEIHDLSNSGYGESATSVRRIETTAGAKTINGTWLSRTGASANNTTIVAYKGR